MYNVNSTRLPTWHGHSAATHPLDDGLIVDFVDKLVLFDVFVFLDLAHRPPFHQGLLNGPCCCSCVRLTKKGNTSVLFAAAPTHYYHMLNHVTYPQILLFLFAKSC